MPRPKPNYDASSRLRMRAYDKLPPAARAALQNAAHNINPVRLLAEMEDAGATDEQLVMLVRRAAVR